VQEDEQTFPKYAYPSLNQDALTSSPEMPPHPQDEVQHHSLTGPESFWAEQASHLEWHKKPTSTLTRVKKSLKSGTDHDHWEWFQGGEISTCYNCVDRHVLAGNGDNTAIIWDSPVTKTKRKYTYKQLLAEVETFAGVLREQGVKKGDVVLMYSKYQIWDALYCQVILLVLLEHLRDNEAHEANIYFIQCP
jgi:hypothetical protein